MKHWQSSWRQNRSQQCASVIANNPGSDGCFIDMLGVAPIHGSYCKPAPPVDENGNLWTDPKWMGATSGLAGAVAAGNPGAVVVGNGLGAGRTYFDSGTSQLESTTDAAMSEMFVRGATDGVTSYRSEDNWKQDVDMLVDAGSHAESVLTVTKLWVSATAAQEKAWHRYTLATFLLGTNGSSWYSFTASKDWAGLTNSSPYDNVSVGAPGGAHPAYAKVAGTAGGTYLYERSFNRGISLVNPTASSATVPLPAGSWTDLDGGTHSGSITLASHDADVLTGP